MIKIKNTDSWKFATHLSLGKVKLTCNKVTKFFPEQQKKNVSNTHFESLSTDFISIEDNFADDLHDSDVDFYSASTPDTQYLPPSKLHQTLILIQKWSISIFHVIIRSMHKNFEAFK